MPAIQKIFTNVVIIDKMAKIRLYKFVIGWLISSLPFIGLSQQITLTITSNDIPAINIGKTEHFKTTFTNKFLCKQYIDRIPAMLQSSGYIGASVDSIKEDSSAIHCYLFLGNRFTWKQVQYDATLNNILPALGIDNSIKEGAVYNRTQVELLQSKLLDFYCNNGYPFAKISWDNIKIDSDNISGKLSVQPGNIYLMDSIRILGSAKVNLNYLYHLLNMPEGAAFSMEKLEQIDNKLKEIPFLKQVQPWSLEMLGNSFLLNLYLEPKKNNQVDAIMGFAPANAQTGGDLLFTIDAKLKLQNVLTSGEMMAINWQQIQPQSPKLNIQFQRPYLFNSSFGLDFSFDLYKKDSSYINIAADIGVQYALSTNQTAKLLFHSFRTNILTVDTTTVISSKRLPDVMDLNINQLVVQYNYRKTNYLNNPRKGNELLFEIAGGSKQIRQNNSISQLKSGSFNYASLYDSVKMNSYTIRTRMNAAHYFPVKQHATIKTALQAGLYNSQNYFTNELFQMGGIKNLRGFDEDAIYCNTYLVFTTEYRYLIDQNSYFAVFSDGGYTSNSVTSINHQYIGGGFGLSFQTKQGIFNISLAAGKRDDLPFNFNQSKIHFGFVSVF